MAICLRSARGSFGMLVQALMEIQQRHGYLPGEELEFLALRAGVPLYRVEEVTTFFPWFRREKPPRLSLRICQSMTCHLRGAADLIAAASPLAGQSPGELEVRGVSCLGRCDRAPVATLTDHSLARGDHAEMLFTGLTADSLARLIDAARQRQPLHPQHDRTTDDPPGWCIDVYHPGSDQRAGGFIPPGQARRLAEPLALEPYTAVRRMLANELTPAQVIDRLRKAGLVGMGGAAARTYNKWAEVTSARGRTRYLICNADESEPGTFKDRELLLRTPHLVIEGMLIAGLTVGASRGYLYVRHEYPEQAAACRQEIERARRYVPQALERCPLEVFVSPGLYICGEESALIEVMEGKRAQPRNQPPTIRENGLFDQPTVVNNVETFAWAPSILLRQPADWYRAQPHRFFSVSGDVNRPGVYEVPFSCTLGELIETHAGGMRDGLEFFAVAPSGPSGGFLPRALNADPLRAALDRAIPRLGDYDPNGRAMAFLKTLTGQTLDVRDLPLDVTLFRALGLSLGAGIVVYGAPANQPVAMLDHALNCLQFFANESCGKCVPCRLGSEQLVRFAQAVGSRQLPLPQVEGHARLLSGVMQVTSICGLGRAAPAPLLSWLDHFSAREVPHGQPAR